MVALFQETGFDCLVRTPKIIPLPNMNKAMVHLKLGRNVRIVKAGSKKLCGISENSVNILCKYILCKYITYTMQVQKTRWTAVSIERTKRIHCVPSHLPW